MQKSKVAQALIRFSAVCWFLGICWFFISTAMWLASGEEVWRFYSFYSLIAIISPLVTATVYGTLKYIITGETNGKKA